MGYETKYTLEFNADEKGVPSCKHSKPKYAKFCPECGISVGEVTKLDAIIDFINANGDMVYALGKGNNGAGDSCKWYDYDQDMRAISTAFPDVVFALGGEGEEHGDIWKDYWLGGKVHKTKAKIVLEKFDRNKLV